ncbi:hypothetical protein EYC84_006506 [Monilinia fructicola]|uniref:ATPase AAA-type core domain-containing protein n=1 Tax=Monilinia fructicola TaxID=38448 RepID=A0A5M9KBT9_MONFR|nr:hypothetical protein EYC84_006506 [Monilinia fructicola]
MQLSQAINNSISIKHTFQRKPENKILIGISLRATSKMASNDEEARTCVSTLRISYWNLENGRAKLKALRLEIKGLQKTSTTLRIISKLYKCWTDHRRGVEQLDEERFIVKASSGPRYVVGCRSKVDKLKLKQGTRVALDMTTLTIMRMLPREVDHSELREVIELPLKNPELFFASWYQASKGCVVIWTSRNREALLARAVASIVSSAIVDKYIGESARLIREMFGYAKEHEPCIIFMDEIDAIGGRRFSEGTSADREIQRT